jgi:hypothetical protein
MTQTATATATATLLPRLCTTGTVVCLATGPSLKAEDVDYCRGKATVIAINDAWRMAPWADVLYSSDQHWFPFYKWVPDFKGLKVGLTEMRPSPYSDVIRLRMTGETGIDWTPDCVRSAKNSGGAALNVAVHLGASRIVLLGYDMSVAKNKERHFFGNHPRGLNTNRKYDHWIQLVETMATPLKEHGIDVVNCSRSSALTCFPRRPLRDVL